MRATAEFGDIVVFGSRGHSLMLLRGMEEFWQGRVRVRALIDDIENGFTHSGLGIPVISSSDRLRDYPEVPVLATPASPALRAEIHARLAREGATLFTASCPGQHHVDPAVDYGAGCLVAPYTRLGPTIKIDEGVQVLSTIIAHDVEVGAFSTLNVHSSVMGHVIIGKGVTIAPYAVVANGTRDQPLHIGDGAVIGVGAVISRSVAPGAKMVGNPAMTVDRWKTFSRWLDAQ